jgi:AmmeMemoRadiSam system protein A
VNPAEMVSEKDQQLLLQLARHAIQTTIQKGRRLPAVESLSPLLREKRGTFVTLWEEELRGCIGFPYPVKPLAEAVQEAAVNAALQDPRFPPVRLEELPHIEIEISVLTVPKAILPQKIQVGVHGLIVGRGNRSGLLLPQVAMEYQWDAQTFLEQTCVKAGLPSDAWREKINLYAFEAQVFSEADLSKKKNGIS